jgi:hypothetical protein
MLYVDGRRVGPIDASLVVPDRGSRQCFQLTQLGESGIESLPSKPTCEGDETRLTGQGPWEWRAPADGTYQVAFAYANDHGPINTGVTAAVKSLDVRCDSGEPQPVPVVMPHSVGVQRSTAGAVTVRAGTPCRFSLDQGFNMSDLSHNAHYTGQQGGASGPVNDATIDALLVSPWPTDKATP